MSRVVVQPRAVDDVDDIAAGIAKHDLAAALRFYTAVAETYDMLDRHPFIGSRRSAADPRLAGLRSYGVIGFRNYLVFFVPSTAAVVVVRVFHAARDTDRLMGPIT